jgi:hypothetical protein
MLDQYNDVCFRPNRKPRINPQLVAQQVAQQFTPAAPKIKKEGSGKSDKKNSDRFSKKGKLL